MSIRGRGGGREGGRSVHIFSVHLYGMYSSIPLGVAHRREGGREGREGRGTERTHVQCTPVLYVPEELKDVAALLVTLPVTQVSVERLFSAMKLFKSDLRSRMKADALESLLILKANQ